MTVLAGTAQLPAIAQVVEPKPRPGAVEGFGVPLQQGATKDDLEKPMRRGAYTIASMNRETVLRLLVVPKEEAGFDPEAFLRSSESLNLSEEALARLSATWTLLQFTFETHEAAVYPSLKFLQNVLQRFAELTEGVVSDPVSKVYKLPSEVHHAPPSDPRIDARDFVEVKAGPRDWIYTLGLQKFSLPELEMYGVPETVLPLAKSFMIGISQAVLTGKPLELGRSLGAKRCPIQIVQGGLDPRYWEGIPCFELIPPSRVGIADALLEWQREEAKR